MQQQLRDQSGGQQARGGDGGFDMAEALRREGLHRGKVEHLAQVAGANSRISGESWVISQAAISNTPKSAPKPAS